MVLSAGTRAAGALAALSLSTFAFVTTETLPIGLLLMIAEDLGTSESAVGTLVTVYGLIVVVASVPLTLLARRVPRRHLLAGLLVVFVLANLVSAAAQSYALLLVARAAVALSQAVFWSIAAPTAAGLYPPRLRGRVIAVLFAGPAVASIAGIPAGTWLGQQTDWRVPFAVLSGIGVLALLAIVVLLPTTPPESGHAARGVSPDARRYWLLVVATALAIAGAFTSFTFIAPFLTDVSGFAAAALGPLLLVRGVVGIAGTALGGSLADRWPQVAMTAPIALQAASFLGLYVLGTAPVAAVAFVGLSGLAMAGLTTALSSQVLQVAPGRTDIASAGSSTAFNVGITLGALLGSVLLPAFGVRSTMLAGGLLSLAALVALAVEPLLARAQARASSTEATLNQAHAPMTAAKVSSQTPPGTNERRPIR
ncbi:MFS transporter [Jiangella rhizosphaerae]|uniref:MFS transporter n=1 Tax=Jiangella rhizosphaerae TaxID=2293569 RepID=A0A418KKF1_9ACTN|nr:MFS transporter [Jiangella rhizosphaerae]RIQ15886.1 MFS transporter [Jiangella rhizosphaerae]